MLMVASGELLGLFGLSRFSESWRWLCSVIAVLMAYFLDSEICEIGGKRRRRKIVERRILIVLERAG